MEFCSFDEMFWVIQVFWECKIVIFNFMMMEFDQVQCVVDFVVGGIFVIDGYQECVGESIFLFVFSCVIVINIG